MSIDDAITELAKNSTAVLGFTIVLPSLMLFLVVGATLWIEYDAALPILDKLADVLEKMSQCAPSQSPPP